MGGISFSRKIKGELQMDANKTKVAVLGASDKPQRYSYQAMKMLAEYGYEPVLVHPVRKEIEGQNCYADLMAVKEQFASGIDTVTVYVNSEKSSQQQAFADLHPRRVIFNPGAENVELSGFLQSKGIIVENACTLVLLRSGQF
jgi:predicted CoA-binding protein